MDKFTGLAVFWSLVLPSGTACKQPEWHRLSGRSEQSPQSMSARAGGHLWTTTWQRTERRLSLASTNPDYPKYLPTWRATDGTTGVMSSLTKELGRFFSWPDLPTCGSTESETVKILEIHKTQRVLVCCVFKMTRLLVNQTILPVVIIAHFMVSKPLWTCACHQHAGPSNSWIQVEEPVAIRIWLRSCG